MDHKELNPSINLELAPLERCAIEFSPVSNATALSHRYTSFEDSLFDFSLPELRLGSLILPQPSIEALLHSTSTPRRVLCVSGGPRRQIAPATICRRRPLRRTPDSEFARGEQLRLQE